METDKGYYAFRPEEMNQYCVVLWMKPVRLMRITTGPRNTAKCLNAYWVWCSPVLFPDHMIASDEKYMGGSCLSVLEQWQHESHFLSSTVERKKWECRSPGQCLSTNPETEDDVIESNACRPFNSWCSETQTWDYCA